MNESAHAALRAQFADRSKTIAGIFLLNAETAIEFVEACRAHGFEIAGVEGFKLIGAKIQPRQDDSNDYEKFPPDRFDDCISFLSERAAKGLWFEVVLETTL